MLHLKQNCHENENEFINCLISDIDSVVYAKAHSAYATVTCPGLRDTGFFRQMFMTKKFFLQFMVQNILIVLMVM